MTGSHPQPAPHRETGTEDANDHLAIQAESRTSNFDLPALNSMRPTAPPSRPYGRYAVGLRPSLDPDACFDAPSQDNEARRTNQNNTEVGLDRPRSFRNDLGLAVELPGIELDASQRFASTYIQLLRRRHFHRQRTRP